MRNVKSLKPLLGLVWMGVTVLTVPATLFAQGTVKERATIKGHDEGVLAVAFSPDGRTLATSDFSTVKLWELAKLNVRVALPVKKIWTLAFSPDGKMLATGGGGLLGGSMLEEAKVWHVADGKQIATFKKEGCFVQGVAFSPDGKTLAVGDLGEKVRLWDMATGMLRNTLEGRKYEDRRMQQLQASTPNSCVVYSSDGKTLAAGSDGIILGRLILWDVATGKEKVMVQHKVTSVVFSADGKTLATTGGHAGEIHVLLWETATGKSKDSLRGHNKFTTYVAINCDGVLASASGDKTVKLWNLTKEKAMATLSHPSEIICVAFSKDGQTLACGCLDGTVRLWNVSEITKVGN